MCYSKNGGSSYTTYFYGINAQGDVEKIFRMVLNSDTGLYEEKIYGLYTYDVWGSVTATTAAGNTPATTTLVYRNPIRYRGYVYDNETGFYYLQSRYYDPANHRFINADAYASTGQGFTGTNMFAYCRNNPVTRIDNKGGRDEDIWSLKGDKQGLYILFHWLFCEGEPLVLSGEGWSDYMANNAMLQEQIKEIVISQAGQLENGEVICITITTSAVIENGEDICGYQYLHGTNSDAGGFHLTGAIKKTLSGDIEYMLICTWNDIIDPNMRYLSDAKKASFAKLIPFANPTDYTIHISWMVEGCIGNSGAAASGNSALHCRI